MGEEQIRYSKKPIYSTKILALLLGVNETQLKKIAKNSNKYFQLIQKTKKDGSIRKCYSLKEPLNNIHEKIKTRITFNVYYPQYIQGAIKDRSNLTNAKLHERSKVIIQLDIKDFFPFIKFKQIYNLWRYFFNFSEEVSDLLTNLITLDGTLVPGAKISSDIANLIFWDKEHDLVKSLKKDNLIYSRFVDDINISSKNKISDKLKTNIIQQVHSMINSKELKLKNKKTKILNSNNQLLITGLVVNNKVKVSKEYVDSVYTAINDDQNINSINGKINYIKQTNPKKATHIEKIAKTR